MWESNPPRFALANPQTVLKTAPITGQVARLREIYSGSSFAFSPFVESLQQRFNIAVVIQSLRETCEMSKKLSLVQSAKILIEIGVRLRHIIP